MSNPRDAEPFVWGFGVGAVLAAIVTSMLWSSCRMQDCLRWAEGRGQVAWVAGQCAAVTKDGTVIYREVR